MQDMFGHDTQVTIARSILEHTEGDWARAEVLYISVGDFVELQDQTVLQNGAAGELDELPDSTWSAFAELRTAMADAHRGTWFSCFVTVGRGGDFDFAFEYDRRVYANCVWGDPSTPSDPSEQDPVTDEQYALDLQRFPRDKEFIPDWYPREVTSPRIGDPVEYFGDALNRTVSPLPLEKHLADASPVWASIISEIHDGVPRQIATLTDEFSAELVVPGLSRAKAIWILNGPLQAIAGEPVDRHVWQRSLPNLLDLYRAVKTLPTDARDGLVLELETFPDYTTVPATAPDTTVRTLWDTNTFGNTEHTELLSILTQVVNETAGAIATNDALQRFNVAS